MSTSSKPRSRTYSSTGTINRYGETAVSIEGESRIYGEIRAVKNLNLETKRVDVTPQAGVDDYAIPVEGVVNLVLAEIQKASGQLD